jgi:thiamine pyrophosphokinase
MADHRALLMACGTWPSPDVVKVLAGEAGHVIALDGALARCAENGLQADVVLGDMDSIKPEALVAFLDQGGTVVERAAQDANDLSKGLAYLEALGTKGCTVIGATGGDPQQEWANVLSCAASSLEITCVTTDHTYRFLQPHVHYSIDIGAGVEFSLFALPSATGVQLKDASFPLNDATLEMGSKGLHNVALEGSVHLSFSEGRLMLMKPLTTEQEEGTSEA